MSRIDPRCSIHFLRAFAGSITVAALAAAASAQSTAGTIVPWVYDNQGKLIWKEHEFREDTANTVFALAWDFVAIAGEPTARPDALLLNGPHYDPPEGIAVTGSVRKLHLSPRATQLYVNYSDVPIGTTGSSYASPTFFIAESSVLQSDPSVPPVFELANTPLAPTRAAIGAFGVSVDLRSRAPLLHEPDAAQFPMNAVYITAGISVPMAELDAAAQIAAATASMDILLVKPAGQGWQNKSQEVPLLARSGNSSGACFADFNADGYLDLFVAKPGDGYVGDQSRLLLYQQFVQPGETRFKDVTATHLPALSVATVDVVAADIDRDLDMDLVLANRTVRGGPGGAESIDYYLLNDGTGHFAAHAFPTALTDSRSVAVGDLDWWPGPEIVFGNAGSEGYSNELDLPPSEENEPLQIFRNLANYPQVNFVDAINEFIPVAQQKQVSRPYTWQVLIADFASAPNAQGIVLASPDGKQDLVVVNHRDILLERKNTNETRPASNLHFLINPGTNPARTLTDMGRENVDWATTLVLGDFTRNDDPLFGQCAADTLDFLVGTGNSYSGYDTYYFENRGTGSWPLWNVTDSLTNQLTYDGIPGNERGYGFDFADFNGNGYVDALQASRAYNFLAFDVGVPLIGPASRHWDLTDGNSPVQFSNKRGQLFPAGAEDGVFADFDVDGDLDVLLATQRKASNSHPQPAPETGDSVVLLNPGYDPIGFRHATTTVTAYDAPPGAPPITRDVYVDIDKRNAYQRPTIGDRSYAVDLDNDGDDDAFVHLFAIGNPNGATPKIPQLGGQYLPGAVDRFSAGWRYLRNLGTSPLLGWLGFKDVASDRLHAESASNGFSVNWNRERGVDVLADFDNNGACDFFTAVEAPMFIGPDIESEKQGWDLLFMNRYAGAPVGDLVESSTALQIPRRLNGNATTGCNGVAQGDIDADGFADMFLSCGGNHRFSELLLNRTATLGRFVDEYVTRVPTAPADLDDIIHSYEENLPPVVVRDLPGKPIFVDLDADGDLDLIYPVAQNVPRILRNKGRDVNQDGFVDANEIPTTNQFFDVTDLYIDRIRPIFDSVDSQAVDLDRDGDYDLAFDTFEDEVVLWRNDIVTLGAKPAVTEAWPRVGAVRGRQVTLEGVQLTSAVAIELRSRATGVTKVVPNTAITNKPFGQISFTMPVDAPLGLVQIRVKRANPPTPADAWSRQYFGYFVLGP